MNHMMMMVRTESTESWGSEDLSGLEELEQDHLKGKAPFLLFLHFNNNKYVKVASILYWLYFRIKLEHNSGFLPYNIIHLQYNCYGDFLLRNNHILKYVSAVRNIFSLLNLCPLTIVFSKML